MQRKTGTKVELGKTVSAFESIGASSVIDRTVSIYLDIFDDKVRKIRKLIETSTYDADIAKDIPGTLEIVFQGMLEDTDTEEQSAHSHSSYRDKENLNFQILLRDNYYKPKPKEHAPLLSDEN